MRIAIISLFLAVISILAYPYTKQDKFEIQGTSIDLSVTILVTEDTAKAAAYVRANLDSTAKGSDFDCRGVTFPTQDGKPIIIWLPNLEDKGVISHELFHATISKMQWAGISLTDDTEEIYAYELQYLTNQFNNHVRRSN
jgi:hypothetical protein